MSILICYDGSPSSKQAVSIAESLLSRHRVTLLHVWSPPVAFLADAFSDPGVAANPPQEDLEPLALLRAQEVAGEGAELARVHGHEVGVRLEPNHTGVPETILNVARELTPELIVIGTHGHTAVQPSLLGSVSAAVAARSERPVLIVPAPVDEDHLDNPAASVGQDDLEAARPR